MFRFSVRDIVITLKVLDGSNNYVLFKIGLGDVMVSSAYVQVSGHHIRVYVGVWLYVIFRVIMATVGLRLHLWTLGECSPYG